MKNLCLILSLVLTSFLWSFENSDSIFQESNKLYLANDFENAINGYLSIVDQGISNQILYYNIGNAYIRLDKLGYARLFYEKAKSSMPSEDSLLEDISYNIKIF